MGKKLYEVIMKAEVRWYIDADNLQDAEDMALIDWEDYVIPHIEIKEITDKDNRRN